MASKAVARRVEIETKQDIGEVESKQVTSAKAPASKDHMSVGIEVRHDMSATVAYTKADLFLDQLQVDVTGIVVVMIYRKWDVNAVTGRYLSTDLVVSDSKRHLKNFVVHRKKEEYRIQKNDGYMIEFDGATSIRKAFVKANGFVRYPFQLVDFDGIEPTESKYLIDVFGYIINVMRTNHQKTDSRNLDFYLANHRGQSIRVTLWGALGDKKLSVPVDHSTLREGTFENLLMWARNRKNDTEIFHCKVRIANVRTRKGWNFPSYRLELDITDDTATVVVVMFDDPATTLVGCSAKSVMEDDDEQYLDELKRLSNLEYRDEIKIAELTENFNGMSIEIRKKEKLLQQEQLAYLSTHPSKRLTSFCYDDDDDYNSAITPVLSTEEPVDSLSMEDEHLDTIPTTGSDEVIKSSVEGLVPIPSESEGIPEHKCDVPFHDNSPSLDVSKDKIKDFSESNNEVSSIDDDSFSIDNIDYVEASPPDSELVSSEVMEIVIPEVGGIDDDIPDDNLRDKLLNVNLLIATIEALNDNPLHPPIARSREISSGSTTTHSDISLPDYEAFYFDDDHIKEISSGSPTTHSDISLSKYDSFIFDFAHEEFADKLAHIISSSEYDRFYFRDLPDPGELMSVLNSRIRENLLSTTTVNLPIEDDYSPFLAYVVWIFLAYLTYPVIPPYLHPFGNEDTIFYPGITINHFYSFKPGSSNRHGAFKKFNTHRIYLMRNSRLVFWKLAVQDVDAQLMVSKSII
nr:hypothetical protein [Tanacetum cinerariifolium]